MFYIDLQKIYTWLILAKQTFYTIEYKHVRRESR
jgi:hypothetical protein